MITVEDYLMGRDKDYNLSQMLLLHANATVDRANNLLAQYYADHPDAAKTHVQSGFRPPEINAKTPGAALHSKHMTCQAVDLADPDGLLDDWCMDNLDKLELCELWLEHPSATKGWTHWQIVPPRSGKRVFYP